MDVRVHSWPGLTVDLQLAPNIINYVYPATCNPNSHGSGGAFYIFSQSGPSQTFS